MKILTVATMGVWPGSGCTPMAAPLLMGGRNVCCAVVLENNKINQ